MVDNTHFINIFFTHLFIKIYFFVSDLKDLLPNPYPPIHGLLFVNISLYISLGTFSSPNCTSNVCLGIYLYIIFGGGHFKSDFNQDTIIDTIPVINNNKIINSKSFKIGGVRLINNLVNKSTWNKFGNWIENNLSNKRDIEVVALGGNINKIFKLSGTKLGKPLSLELIDSTISDLEKMSFFDKMINLKLNPDRVDVIVPAGKIYQFVLDKMNVEKITVPKIGLADGMVHELMKKL